MQPFIANTDRAWFDFLSTRMEGGHVDEVNFWLPNATRPMKQMSPGEPVFFRLKSPDNCIAGHGFFAHFQVVPLEEAWDLFGWRNGEATRSQFLRLIGGYRARDTSPAEHRRKPIGCTILREARFWPERRWIRWDESKGWHRNLVQGKTERDPARVVELLAQIRLDHAELPAEFASSFTPQLVDDRRLEQVTQVRREGQGTFRLRLLNAYGRCAITGERTQPVLDAAHIQPYLGPASNHVQNGLLLTKEFHALFDRGYVTVTPDYQVRVSAALREDWQNGVRYYAHDRTPLKILPEAPAQRPSRDALAWHLENRFLG
ncbi:MAG: HNH endonuclease [Myxococcales bacterium]|nr:HNH endonuclease [Myxococcales bacterium]